MRDDPGYAVGFAWLTVHMDFPVALGNSRSRPRPALISFATLDVLPEPLQCRQLAPFGLPKISRCTSAAFAAE